jgi:aspartate kinase
MKFGGTSVEDAKAIRNVAQLIALEKLRRPVVVVSACAGVTNILIELAKFARDGNGNEASALIGQLYRRHLNLVKELLTNPEETERSIQISFDELSGIIKSVQLLGELSARVLDRILCFGESWSARLLTDHLQENNVNAQWIPSASFLITTAQHQRAEPLTEIIQEKLFQLVLPLIETGCVIVTQGFVGATQAGTPTTLGRGGSDYSASIIGAAVGAEEIQIWTDTDGVMSADPRIVEEAFTLPQVTYQEAAELAALGAKVLHPKTIAPAIEKHIPIRVLNSRNPGNHGTVIRQERNSNDDGRIKCITSRKRITKITLAANENLLMRCTAIGIHPEFLTLNGKTATLFIEECAALDEFEQESEKYGAVIMENNFASVSLIRENIGVKEDLILKAAEVFFDLSIRPAQIYYGESGRQLSFLVRSSEADTMVRAFHSKFFEGTCTLQEAAAS